MKEGWTYKKLKEVGRTQTGTTPSKSVKSFYEGEIPFIRPAELDIDGNGSIEYNSELKLTPEGALKSRKISANSILMCCIGSVGKTGYAIKDVTCNQQINTITPYMGYNGRFVYYALMAPSFQNEVKKIANSAKATLAIISKGKWEELSIPVPPLSEQQSIVDYLDSVFAQIDELKSNAERQLAEARALFQSALTQAMQPRPGWQSCKFNNLIDNLRTGLNPRTHFKLNTIDSVGYYITVRELKGFTFEVDNRTDRINEDAIKRINERSNLKIGDVLYSGTGTIGKTALVQELPTWWNIKEGVYAITPKANILDSSFLIYVMHSDYFMSEVLSKTSGTTVRSIPMKQLKEIVLSIPSLQEQRSIAQKLDIMTSHISELEEISRKTAAECDVLKQALLRQIFE